MQHDLLCLKVSLYGGTQNHLSDMSGFNVNGASLTINQDLQWEAAGPAMPL